MSQSKIGEGATQPGGAGRHQACKPTVFVAACVTIVHLGFNWLDAVDSYAFLALGNLVSSATGAATAAMKPDRDSVVVVRIDEQTFLERYRERSPLDRCVLQSQLEAIYKAEPEILVIDLDLSPVEGEEECQQKLHATLGEWAKKTRTVVMDPFDSFDSKVTKSRKEWREEQEKVGIHFGDAALPVNYGIALNYYIDKSTLYAAARPPKSYPSRRDQQKVDVRAYSAKLQPVLTSWTYESPPSSTGYDDIDLTDTLRMIWSATERRIVFFGAGYGQEDTYLTAIGKLYGVEVHAAAFWTSNVPGWLTALLHVIELAIDILIAFVFSIVIAYCWTRYFAWSCEKDSAREQLASMWVAAMLVGLAVAILLSSAFAFVMLRFGLWLSPIPLAVGMLIEGCMTGPVEAAVDRSHSKQSDPAGSTPAPDSITQRLRAGKTAIWWLALAGALGLALLPLIRSVV